MVCQKQDVEDKHQLKDYLARTIYFRLWKYDKDNLTWSSILHYMKQYEVICQETGLPVLAGKGYWAFMHDDGKKIWLFMHMLSRLPFQANKPLNGQLHVLTLLETFIALRVRMTQGFIHCGSSHLNKEKCV